MSTRYQKVMRRQGSARFLKLGSRVFTFHHMAGGQGRELTEVLSFGDNSFQSFPGYVRGQKHYGFAILNSVALDRKYAMAERDPWRRQKFISRAYQGLDTARGFGRPQLDPVEARFTRDLAA